MTRRTIISIVGTRPNFIKLAALSPELRKHFDEVIIHTGQHYDDDMSQQFFDRLTIPKPDYKLGVGSGSQGEQLGKMFQELERVLEDRRFRNVPVIVYGDTNSTFAGALMAKRMGHSVIHVEAGLRSEDLTMPEEQNRVMIDAISDIKFCPTPTAYSNLVRAGLDNLAHLVGDLHATLFNKVFLPTRKPKTAKHILCTIHRPANTDTLMNLNNIVEALIALGRSHQVIWPVHPRTMAQMKSKSGNGVFVLTNDIRIESPKGYLEMMGLIDQASVVITDSGGVQKEAWFCQTPCVTVRDSTEWVETLDGRWNQLVKPVMSDILEGVTLALAKSREPQDHADRAMYGLNGDPAKLMAEKLVELLGGSSE